MFPSPSHHVHRCCVHPVQIPTAEEASRTAYGLLTAPSANTPGVISAPSGRGIRKHVCLHPGCGKVFHLKASAAKHQEKEHRFRRRLGEKIIRPFVSQSLSRRCLERK